MEITAPRTGWTATSERIPAALTSHPVLILGVYFLAQALIRALLGAPPNLDEAEQFALSDHYAFGYGPHPPLYQWLQTTAFNILGVNFLAIAVVKNAILFGAYATLYFLAREVTGSRILAVIASFGLLFCANFAWESQIDHTHTVSNTFLTAVATLLMFRLASRPSAWGYVALGVAIGLGLLAKYNFLLFLLAIVLAFAMDRQARRIVISPWFALSMLIAVAIAAPHYLYIAADPQTGAAKIANLGFNRYGFVGTRLAGLATFLAAIAGVHGVWLAITALGYADWKMRPRALVSHIPEANQPACARMLRLWLILMLIFVGLVLVGGTTSFRDHWLQPESVFFPLVLAIILGKYIDAIAFRRLALAAVVLMLTIPLVVIAHKRLFTGAQRDAAMPDPAALTQLQPGISTGELPLIVLGEDAIARWFASGHLRYWLQIPPPPHSKLFGILPSGPLAILFASKEADPMQTLAKLVTTDLTGFGAPVEVASFRPGQVRKKAARWFLVVR
jgi:4-amino-4-deoxy-L-arabinose transferase-like glycosyltransferase